MDTYEAQAAKKLHAALPVNPRAGIRPMEAVWFLIACVLFVSHLENSDVSHQVIEESHAQEGCIAQHAAGERYAKPMTCAPMVEAPNHILSLPILVSQ